MNARKYSPQLGSSVGIRATHSRSILNSPGTARELRKYHNYGARANSKQEESADEIWK